MFIFDSSILFGLLYNYSELIRKKIFRIFIYYTNCTHFIYHNLKITRSIFFSVFVPLEIESYWRHR